MAVARPERLIVPDVLRGVAIVAMLLAHAAPLLPQLPGTVRFAIGNINDLASPLFALVMGMSAQLVWASSRGTGRTLVQQTIRGVVLIALGVWMATWGSWVAIVLSCLGVLIIVGTPLLLLGSRALAVVLALVVLIGAPLNDLARGDLVQIMSSNIAVRYLADWTVLGHSYRLTNLLPFFLLGALLLRGGLRRDRTMWIMLAVAPFAYLVRPVLEKVLHQPAAVSGSYPDTLHDVGLVFATYAVVVLLATRPRRGMVPSAASAPLRVWGQLALSLYLLHVWIVSLWFTSIGWPTTNVPIGWITVVVVPLAVGWLWWRYVGTGPVEWLMAAVSGRRKPLTVRRRATVTAPTSG
ncbi:heparan-alpha-glucosaminide N-acetyltransferase domain-containing protein [Microbacterium sp. 22242]|uniref:heparan-alpha-glucosaminide N-acetyltransferase domain-containing protein n=1 Tax=Microbacterium sp. 22242 TaxID=3453896 RepID=UPI003F83E682